MRAFALFLAVVSIATGEESHWINAAWMYSRTLTRSGCVAWHLSGNRHAADRRSIRSERVEHGNNSLFGLRSLMSAFLIGMRRRRQIFVHELICG
ncbi:hypothetical protein F4680DRAFT_439535 [Xylaria scruposa]|nr:hypothetical protein F4680DRAFT_439535 [Xylaria scruposa]